jgi:hypothetical protein
MNFCVEKISPLPINFEGITVFNQSVFNQSDCSGAQLPIGFYWGKNEVALVSIMHIHVLW